MSRSTRKKSENNNNKKKTEMSYSVILHNHSVAFLEILLIKKVGKRWEQSRNIETFDVVCFLTDSRKLEQ